MSPFPPRAFSLPLSSSGGAANIFARVAKEQRLGEAGTSGFVGSLCRRSFLPTGASASYFSSASNALTNRFVTGHLSASSGTFLRLSPKRLGGSLEDYYTNSQLATCIQSPWPFYIWSFWAFMMVVVPVGLLFQSNYYFAGRILPKVNGNTQLCEDSW